MASRSDITIRIDASIISQTIDVSIFCLPPTKRPNGENLPSVVNVVEVDVGFPTIELGHKRRVRVREVISQIAYVVGMLEGHGKCRSEVGFPLRAT